jgi:tetratricopeptide (TPR) repeat protein
MRLTLSRSSFFFVQACLSAALLFSALTVSGQEIQYNFEYTCGHEKVVVGHCRRDDDTPNFPRTADADNYCMVYYPERPKRGGFTVQEVELRGDIVKKLEACRAFASPSSDQSADPDVDQSIVELHRGEAYYENGDYAGALAKFKHSNEITASSAASLMIGKTEYQLKHYQAAIGPLKETIRTEPDNEAAHFWLSMAYREQGIDTLDTKLFPLAESEMREAIRLKPDDQQAYLFLGTALQVELKFEQSIEAADQALRLKPDDTAAMYLKGSSSAHLGQKEAAMQMYRKVLALDPTLAAQLLDAINKAKVVAPAAPVKPTAANQPSTKPAATKPAASGDSAVLNEAKAALNAAVDDDDFKNVIELSNKALAANPRATEAYECLALAYHELMDYQHAVDAFAKYVSPTTSDYSIIYLYADSYSKLEKYDKAIPIYRRAMKLAASQQQKTTALFGIANAYYEMNDYANGLEQFRQLSLVAPTNDDVLYYLGMCYMRLGKKVEAQQVQKKLEPINKISAGNLQTWIDAMK